MNYAMISQRLLKALMLLCAGALAACASGARSKGGGLQPFAPSGSTNQALQGKRYALLVGVDHFEDEKFGDLRFATKDAYAMAQALKTFDKVILLNTPETTTRAAILDGLSRLQARVKSKRDTVVLYFSTHGTLARRPGGELRRYLVANDTRMSVTTSTAIAVDDILTMMSKLTSRQKALIIASCHSGGGKSTLSDDLTKSLAKQKGSLTPLEEVSEATFVLSASSFKEAAQEEDALGHDVYTYFFLEGIQKGDRDEDGAITISEAHDYARERTYQFTKGAQRPMAVSSILGRDPMILAGRIKKKPRPVIYSYRASAQGIEVHLGGRKKGVLPGGVVASAGTHNLELRSASDQSVLYKGEITLREGDRFELTEVIVPLPRYTLELGTSFWTPLAASVRDDFLPPTPAFGGQFTLTHLPWSWSFVGAAFSYGTTQGNTVAFGEELPFALQHWDARVHAGGLVELFEDVHLLGGLGFGGVWAKRTFDLPTFEDVERVRGTTYSAIGILNWRLFDHWSISFKAEAGALRAPLDFDYGPYAFGRASVMTGFSF